MTAIKQNNTDIQTIQKITFDPVEQSEETIYAIEIEGLMKKFRSRNLFNKYEVQAINDINLKINKGEIFGLIGANGAGKTTLIRLLTGLLNSDAGKAEIFGFSLNQNLTEIRKLISLLPQEASCYETLTVWENIFYYGGLHGNLNRQELTERTNYFVQLFNLEDKKDQTTKKLSGGMKRKVMVARALISDPQLIFLDEPTAGLDIHAAKQIRDFIKDLVHTNGRTVFLTSHDIRNLTDLCDRIGIIHQGELIAVGTIAELTSKYNCSNLEDLFIRLTSDSKRRDDYV